MGLCLLYPQSQITFRQLSVKEGLSQNSVVSITQDSTGYLWIATQDGLNRYDGRNFNLLPYSFVDITKPDYSNLGKVYTDRKGEVWIIPQNKIPHKYNKDPVGFEPIPIVDDASVVFQDRAFNTWFGTYSSGLFVLPHNAGEPLQVLGPDAIQGTVYNIAQHSFGNLMLAKDNEIVSYDTTTAQLLNIPIKTIYGEPITANFSDIVFDKEGTEWLSTFGHGLYFKEQDATAYQRIDQLGFTDPLPADLNITDLHFDKKNRLWIATYGGGLYMIEFKLHKISHFKVAENDPKTLHYDDVLCIYEDYSGTLWFGTDGAGISYYDEYLEKFNSLTNYQTPENINIDVVRALVVDANETIWIGTSGKGLTRYEPATNSWQAFKANGLTENTIPSDRVMSLLVDTDNNLWIGSQGNGLSIFDDQERFTHFSPRSKIPLSAETIWDIFRDEQNRFWLATREQGLILFDKDKGELKKYKTQKEPEKGPPGNNVRVIASGKNGRLWLGTEEEGIASFDPTTETFIWYRHSSSSNSIASNNIKSLYEDVNGILWIGTNGAGLSAFDTKKSSFRSYTIDDGLANNVIYGILPDEERNLWLSSNKGITKFAPGNTLDDTPSIVNYANYDGLATEFNTGAYYKDSSGNLYFGGLDGFYWFKPTTLKENNVLPKTSITGLQIFNESRPLTKKLDLKHTENTVTFSFSSMQFSLPEKNQYRYRLLNYEKDWVQAGNTNFARYSQLPPGTYEFQVKSSNYDGAWNENAESYEFTIRSPWYLTPLAKVVYFMLFLTGIYGIYSYLKWRLRMRLNLRLKQEEAARLQRLNDFKTKLYTDVSHEFRTPLTLISGPVDAKLSEGSLSETDFTNFSMIKRNTNRLIALVDQLLHLAKLEKGKLKLKISEGNLGLFLQMLASAFDYRATQRDISYSVKVVDLDTAWYDEDALEKIVTNLLSNAFKHGQEGGDCQLEASCKNGHLQLSVKNTVAPETGLKIEQLFSRFYQQDEHAEGAGVGLSLTKELVHLHQGEITVEMEEGNSIHFQVFLPIQREVYPDLSQVEIITETAQPILGLEVNGVEVHPIASENPDNEELPILLLVEDHKEVREFIKSVWKNKFRLIEANNGRSGIKKALEVVPDLIITDVRMPVCDGIELCNTLKTDERTSHIPIILLTAGVGEEQELMGLQSGADDFITKPFKLRILETKVENLIASRKRLRNRYSQEVVLKAKDIAVTHTDTLFFHRVQKVLDEQLSDPDFSVASFCKSVGMSRMQLHRKLMAFTGLSTSAFIRSQRLKQAVHILKTSDATINEVAYTVGFNTPSYFIKCFKEIYKKTPAEYLKSLD
ncbi:two-component regulator propeller domain-containing protein [Aggregatimonas sangjinii]|uniref:two-component regulator propeller domain-containing protein n=1 Tax=Aggregatimonas sangjinii TaxID=2583587 RepID=UPI0015868DE3|nr:two-component regulator propeller domain-containing protein [Aggregatimonas sangjinii]